MTATNFPVLPVAGSAVLRASLALVALVTHWLKGLARARRHRRDARSLAALDPYMLADIGITRADLSDAFSSSFWEDPTELLADRAGERRRNRPRSVPGFTEAAAASSGFHRLPLDRPARQTI